MFAYARTHTNSAFLTLTSRLFLAACFLSLIAGCAERQAPTAQPPASAENAPPFAGEPGAPIATNDSTPATPGALIDPAALDERNRIRSILLAHRAPRAMRPQISLHEENQENLGDLIDPSELTETQGKILKDPRDIDARGYQSVKLSGEVWSGSAWAMYRGATAQRYRVSASASASSWQEAWQLVHAPGSTLFDIATAAGADPAGTTSALDDLGPAEKYDLLVAAPKDAPIGLLSQYEWEQGGYRQKKLGTVAHWFGYCHGWAAASFMLGRPQKTITVPSADGTLQLKFFPSDIKALSTALWANGTPSIRVIGNRCETANPKRDPNGRIIDETCFDVNPGTFHLAVINELAGARKHLIMDATYDIEIWNQPIISYEYRYFNPQKGKSAGASKSFDDGVIAIGDYTKDKFTAYRSPKTKQVVGVSMKVVYGLGGPPSRSATDSVRADKTKTVEYLYDLELDDQNEIIGGEWYQLKHPDFIWAIPEGSRALSAPEKRSVFAGSWDGSTSVPDEWRAPAVEAAALGQPLAGIVDGLIAKSRSN